MQADHVLRLERESENLHSTAEELLVLSGDFRDFLSVLERFIDRRAPSVAPIPTSRPPTSMFIAVS